MARYLILGHITRDLVPQGFRYGGAVLYGGLTARRIGFETRVVTASAEPDLEILFPELSFWHLSAPQTTVFENLETETGRRQRVLAKALPLDLSALPPAWRQAEIVHLAPVLDEIVPEEAALLDTNFLVANPQGWFRQVLPSGEVVRISPDFTRLPRFQAVVVSDEDLGYSEILLKGLLERCDLVVLTKGSKGAVLYYRRREIFFPADLVPPKDPTGAGDVLAAAFFGALYAGKAPEEALRLGMCLARLSVTREGLSGVPTREEISFCLEAIKTRQY